MEDPPGLVLVVLMLVFVSSCIAKPRITSPPQTLAVEVGSTAIFNCWVEDLGSNVITWEFVSHDLVIYEGDTKKTDHPHKYSLIKNDGDVVMYNLQILELSETDQGFYRCSAGPGVEIVSHLDIIEKENLPAVFSDNINVTDCCIEHGVSQDCLPACYPPDIDLDTFNVGERCNASSDAVTLTKCLSDGSNHDSCCLYRGVRSECLPLCHNQLPLDEHADLCLADQQINALISCAVQGADIFPGAPTSVAALVVNDGSPSILVSWGPPVKNSQEVTGYKIMYRKVEENTYSSIVLHDPSLRSYRLTSDKEGIKTDQGYKLHVVALADHGISLGSVEVDLYVRSASNQALTSSIDDCCKRRDVSSTCRSSLCHAKTWSEFHTGEVLQCLPHIDDIFTCLAGERINSKCCSAYEVTAECLPLCSGHPPSFDNSLIGCVAQMGVIQACVQQGYVNQPAPPTNLQVIEVTNEIAEISFDKSTSPDVTGYKMEIRTGSLTNPFLTTMQIGKDATSFQLRSLTENTYYWVRLVAVAPESGSLPSETISFLTYSDSFVQPVEPPPNRDPYNFTQCCVDSGMPANCYRGCIYRPNMTAYYSEYLQECYSSIGTVLACASDGRDHRSCCNRNNIEEGCLGLCVHTKPGPLEQKYVPLCVPHTSTAVVCYLEGLLDLPSHPDVRISGKTSHTISVQWEYPDSGSEVDMYRITWQPVTTVSDNTSEDTTDKLNYIIQDLIPDTDYLINVYSMNENGTSAPSPTITENTLPDIQTIPSPNITEGTAGRAFWDNITDCCENSVSAPCREACINKQTNQDVDSACFDDSLSILACYADGADHRDCCERKGLPSVCVPICGGNDGSPGIHQATCFSYAHREIILSCFIQWQGLIPGAPSGFTAKPSQQADLNVTLSWTVPDYCGSDCLFTVFYWDVKTPESKMEMQTTNTSAQVEVPEGSRKYTFMAVAHNTYGSGPPSTRVTLFMEIYKRDVKVVLYGDEPVIDEGGSAILVCSIADFPVDIKNVDLRWVYNGRTVGRNRFLRLSSLNAFKNEGEYVCEVTDNFITSSASLYLPIRAKPVFDQLKHETAPPGLGLQGKVACWFRGFPDTDKYSWLKDGVQLNDIPAKMVIGVDRRYHTGITAYRVKIANLDESDYGLYSISVSNKFGSVQCSVKLNNPDEIDTPTSNPVEPNPQECCASKGVSELCQELCGYHVNVEEVLPDVKYKSCLANFDTYISCGADGRDHTKCCREKGVLPFCQPMCRGVVPANVLTDQLMLLTCLGDWEPMMGCIEQGVKRIPFRPNKVSTTVSLSGTTVTISWTQPLLMRDQVDHFIVYYTHLKTNRTEHVAVNQQIQHYQLQGLEAMSYYDVWLVSGNKYGSSLPTPKIQVETFSYSLNKPTNVEVTPVPGSSDVRVTWMMKRQSEYKYFIVSYEVENSGIKQTKVTSQAGTLLKNLKPMATYTLTVSADRTGGLQSPTSKLVRFTTLDPQASTGSGRGDPSKDKDKVAIGVGVTVAVIALIAIVLLIIFFVFKSRLSRPVDDRVAFENPGFGSVAQVKMHGLQDQQGFGYGQLDEEAASNAPTESSLHQNNAVNTEIGSQNVYSQAQPQNYNPSQAGQDGMAASSSTEHPHAYDNTGFMVGSALGEESSTDPPTFANPMYDLAATGQTGQGGGQGSQQSVATLVLDGPPAGSGLE